MGIVSFLKKVSQGNYGLIARNITYTYCSLVENYEDQIESGEDLFLKVGQINGAEYLRKFQITEREIMMALLLATEGKCGISGFSQIHDFQKCKGSENDILINFIMNMQALYFSIDSNLSIDRIVTSLIRMKPDIEEAVDSVFRDFKYNLNRKKNIDKSIYLFMKN